MNPRLTAVRAGLTHGRIEFRHNAGQIFSYVLFPVLALALLHFVADRVVSETEVSIATWAIPGMLAMNIVLAGLLGLAMTLIMERDDGTLLRAKATPNGVLGYLVGKVVSQAAMSITAMLIVLVPAVLLFDGLQLDSPGSWTTLASVLALGMAAVLPLGAILGALFSNPRNFRLVTLLFMVVVGISGVFYPLSALPPVVQWMGQALPLYWIALGMRSALLPDALSQVEVASAWQHMETFAVLGVWSAVGFAVAPLVLRRMARRVSGSRVPTGDTKARQTVPR
ncbi:ABC transporter permease [Nocardiopsis sp. HUAS JQ3]|uniref:ABC transporter permease n=1 Tax=Nocardiopsis sp. HUAS JQ3 TaxID=3061629 RepID=UPI0023A98710|nr:ABC transporter permease [Nocardiopsis sp. HUAS JQ3]WDZ90610.1 ABC transporter permease [Nocardiopsis sp. HUAS JQ3]